MFWRADQDFWKLEHCNSISLILCFPSLWSFNAHNLQKWRRSKALAEQQIFGLNPKQIRLPKRWIQGKKFHQVCVTWMDKLRYSKPNNHSLFSRDHRSCYRWQLLSLARQPEPDILSVDAGQHVSVRLPGFKCCHDLDEFRQENDSTKSLLPWGSGKWAWRLSSIHRYAVQPLAAII